MTKIQTQYKDILVTAVEGENGIGDVKVFLSKGKKPTGANAKLTKAVEGAIKGKINFKDLDMSWATPFQARVYREMVKIKPGRVLTYAELAKKIGAPKAYRAVASACARNQIPLIIPCHRVVRTGGGLGGYSSKDGLKMKRYLLNLEGYKVAA